MSRPRSNEDVFRAIADPTRRAILDRLIAGPRSVSALLDQFEMSQPALSLHLRVLRDAELVRSERAGRNIMYSVNPVPLRAVSDWLAHYERFWNQRLTRLASHLDRKKR